MNDAIVWGVMIGSFVAVFGVPAVIGKIRARRFANRYNKLREQRLAEVECQHHDHEIREKVVDRAHACGEMIAYATDVLICCDCGYRHSRITYEVPWMVSYFATPFTPTRAPALPIDLYDKWVWNERHSGR